MRTKNQDYSNAGEVPVVKDYPGVFPDDLPGSPTDREIEFIINLQPGTPPMYDHHIEWHQRVERVNDPVVRVT